MVAALPTREDYFQVGAQEIFARSAQRTRSSRISPEAVFTEGTDINIINAACSAMADEATRHLALRMAALFLDGAEGQDLDRLVADRFSPTVVRKQPAPAVVPLTFTRPIPPSLGGSVTLAVGTKVRTENGVEFNLTQPASFPINSTGPITANAQAVLAGRGGNVEAGTITQFSQTPADPAIVVTNLQAASGGADQETDASLRERARDFFRTARRAILAAIEFGALTVDGVVSATAIEVLDVGTGLPSGDVQVFIADAQGQSNSILAAAVVIALREFRAAGIIVTVLTTVPRFESIAYQLAFRSGTDTVAAVVQLKALTVAAVGLLNPQEPLLRSMLMALARAIPGAIVTETAVPVPAGDIVPGIGEVIKTRADLVTVNGV
jgi:uncharacterized phage protein gp47/JayE